MANVTARTICCLINIREYGELLCEMRFPLNLKEAVYMSQVRPSILHGSDAWCLKEDEIRIL